MSESKKILVTGSGGFVGANLTRKLIKEGQEVHSILRETDNEWRIKDVKNQLNVHLADLSNRNAIKEIVKKVKPEIVYHLAVYGGYSKQQDWQKIIESNIKGTSNLLEASKENNVGYFVNTGSSSEYGIKEAPMKETDLTEPLNFYGVSKVFTTTLCRQLWHSERMPTITIRPFSVYGYFEEPGRLVPYVIECCLKGKNIGLESPGNVRDFIFVEDLVEAYLLVTEKEEAKGEIINIGTGKQHSVRDIAELVIKLIKANAKIEWGKETPRSYEPKKWIADNSKAERLLGWKPKHELREGLQKTINWQKKHGYREII